MRHHLGGDAIGQVQAGRRQPATAVRTRWRVRRRAAAAGRTSARPGSCRAGSPARPRARRAPGPPPRAAARPDAWDPGWRSARPAAGSAPRPRRAPPGTGSARARTARAAAHRPTVRDNGARADGWRRPAPASCPPAPPRPRAAARERVGAHRHHLGHAQVEAQPRFLRQHGAPARQPRGRHAGQILPSRRNAPRRRATRRPARPAASTCRRRWRPAGPPLRPARAPATPARAPPRDRMTFSAASVIRPSCPAPAATGRRASDQSRDQPDGQFGRRQRHARGPVGQHQGQTARHAGRHSQRWLAPTSCAPGAAPPAPRRRCCRSRRPAGR